ncbi:MAG: hypothetical protein LAQ30_01615 [Acidobacteriia bacterium]|nr:hypothetical protein [Terriglobia bacterium]
MSKSKKKNPARRPKPNPAFFKASKPKKGYQKKHRHVRNPNVIEKPIEALKFGLLALLGLVATRQVPQLLLKEKNTGIMGYVSNLATAVAAGLGTGKFVSPAAGNAVMIGGGLYTINRVLTEQFSPVGKVLSLAGVGDHQASATLGGIRPVGLYPPAYDKNGRPIIGKEYIDAIGAALPAPPAAPSRLTGVSRVRSSRI